MKIQQINKSYGDKTILEDINISLPKGKVISFIGPNGAGKSTLLNIVTRLIKQDSGEALVDDKEINKWKSNELSKKLAILTQKQNINMKLRVKELVAFGRYPHSENRLTELDKEKIREAIDFMGLTELKNKYIDELSGGQLQRVYIAMTIAQDTEYIFLDEPTNNLDIFHSSNLMKLVRKLSVEKGKTVILVLHEINFASVYSDYIGAFLDGKLYKFGTVDEVITKETLKKLYNVDFEITRINDKPISIYY